MSAQDFTFLITKRINKEKILFAEKIPYSKLNVEQIQLIEIDSLRYFKMVNIRLTHLIKLTAL